MALELGRALLIADAVTPDAMAEALFVSVTEHTSLVRSLLAVGAIEPARLEEELARMSPDTPLQRHVVPVQAIMDRLPVGLCARLVALPVRRDALTGTVDVAVADPRDTHAAQEIAFFLSAPVRILRATLSELQRAIEKHITPVSMVPALPHSVNVPPPSPVRMTAETPEWGTPIVQMPHVTDEAMAEQMMEQMEEDAPERPRPSYADIPIPLTRRTPAHGTILGKPTIEAALQAAVHQDNDEIVVELRRVKPPSRPAMPAVTPSVPPPSVRPTTDLEATFRKMKGASDRDLLLDLVLEAVADVAPKAALFAAKREGFMGWTCTTDFGDRAAVARTKLDGHRGTIAQAATDGAYVGPLKRDEGNAPIFRIVRDVAPAAIAVAIRVQKRTAAVILACDAPDPKRAEERIRNVARIAGEALEKLVRARK